MKYKVSLEDAIRQLKKETQHPFTTVMKNSTMRAEYYKPDKIDLQTSHKQDELYIVISGSGIFVRSGERMNFQPNDILFVPAGMKHRFENFSADFATWVIFYGPENDEGLTG